MSRVAVAEAYRHLGQCGLIEGSSGNISVRDGDGMLISPTGTSPDRIAPDTVVRMGLDTPAPQASSEWPLHASLYEARPDLGAIVHTHADACTALACLNEPLPVFHYSVLVFGGVVRCAPYVTFGTPELAVLAVAAMQDRTACLLGNHGMIAAGATLADAVDGALALERLCRQYLLARSAGLPRLLTAAEVEGALARLRIYQLPLAPAVSPWQNPSEAAKLHR